MSSTDEYVRQPNAIENDPVLVGVKAEAAADPDVIGVLLGGSRGAGAIHAESDYDICLVITDEAWERWAPTEAWPPRAFVATAPGTVDLWYICPALMEATSQPAWELRGYAEAVILLDKTGATATALATLVARTATETHRAAAAAYDHYLNSLYRSLKAWRRGNELGARLQAADSAYALLEMLFALEGRHRPYHDRLWLHLDSLAGQGWQPGELQQLLLELLSTGAPRQQQLLARRVAALMAARGFDQVYVEWDGQIDEILAWAFPAPGETRMGETPTVSATNQARLPYV
ncbi:MAG: hypothetical protein KF832_27020 [Caldilineaceae bacterium]|nr:hypothetical protein [Caldilineaceae bacterium]